MAELTPPDFAAQARTTVKDYIAIWCKDRDVPDGMTWTWEIRLTDALRATWEAATQAERDRMTGILKETVQLNVEAEVEKEWERLIPLVRQVVVEELPGADTTLERILAVFRQEPSP